jgi:Ca2+-binding EF-hand superfamily protein
MADNENLRDTVNPMRPSKDAELGKTKSLTKSKSEKVKSFAEGDITHNVVQAVTLQSGLTYNEMVLVVHNNLSSFMKKKENCTIFRFDVQIAEELFKLFDRNGDGEATADEVDEVLTREEIKKYLNSLNNQDLKTLIREAPPDKKTGVKKRVFSKAIAQSKPECITKEEWLNFMSRLRRETLITYRKKAMLNYRVYMGLGLEPGKPYDATLTKYLGVRC